ncbi:MAG: hypothetical protein P8Y02_15760 [Deinococcales bacterium]
MVVPRPGQALDEEGVPKHVRLTDRLPKSGAGKILKNELREAFARSGEVPPNGGGDGDG